MSPIYDTPRDLYEQLSSPRVSEQPGWPFGWRGLLACLREAEDDLALAGLFVHFRTVDGQRFIEIHPAEVPAPEAGDQAAHDPAGAPPCGCHGPSSPALGGPRRAPRRRPSGAGDAGGGSEDPA